MKKMLFILVLLFIPSIIYAEQGYLDVTASGNRQLQLAITAIRSPAGMENSAIVKDVSDILQFDMTLAGPFSVKTVAGNEGNGIRPGEFDIAPWKAAGFDLLVKSSYAIADGNITLEFRLYDVFKNREMVAKRYVGNIFDLRKIVHTFADEIMQAVTGETGPFTGKIAFVSKRTRNKEIYLMDYDGYNVQRLTRNGSINLDPDFSRMAGKSSIPHTSEAIPTCSGGSFSAELKPQSLPAPVSTSPVHTRRTERESPWP